LTDEAAAAPNLEFDRFEFVLLRRPASPPTLSEAASEALQQRHLDHLASMHEANHLVVAGPFDEQPDEALRGLCLYHTGSIERTRELAGRDPAVLAGRLEVEVMYLYCKKGAIPVPWDEP
jgi:uncharacterized protein YciI